MSAVSWLARYFISAFVLDDDGVGNLTPSKMRATGESKLELDSEVSGVTTPDDDPVTVLLASLAAGDVVQFDLVVTGRSSDGAIAGAFKLSALAAVSSGDAFFVGADGTDPDPKRIGDVAIAAQLTTSDGDVLLEITGSASAAMRWGWEVRRQRQAF